MDLGLGFGTWIWDLDLGLGFGTGLGLDNNFKVDKPAGVSVSCLQIVVL